MKRSCNCWVLAVAFVRLLNAQQTANRTEVLPSGKGAAAIQIQTIGDEVRLIEEKSLIFQGGMDAGGQQEYLPGAQADPFNQEATTGNLPIGPRMRDMKEDTPNAYRCYGFNLAPGEQIKLKLKCEDHGKVIMRFLPKSVADAMSAQVRKANNAPAPFRASRMEIKNITDGPYLVALLLYGQANYSFRLDIERVPKK